MTIPAAQGQQTGAETQGQQTSQPQAQPQQLPDAVQKRFDELTQLVHTQAEALQQLQAQNIAQQAMFAYPQQPQPPAPVQVDPELQAQFQQLMSPLSQQLRQLEQGLQGLQQNFGLTKLQQDAAAAPPEVQKRAQQYMQQFPRASPEDCLDKAWGEYSRKQAAVRSQAAGQAANPFAQPIVTGNPGGIPGAPAAPDTRPPPLTAEQIATMSPTQIKAYQLKRMGGDDVPVFGPRT